MKIFLLTIFNSIPLEMSSKLKKRFPFMLLAVLSFVSVNTSAATQIEHSCSYHNLGKMCGSIYNSTICVEDIYSPLNDISGSYKCAHLDSTSYDFFGETNDRSVHGTTSNSRILNDYASWNNRYYQPYDSKDNRHGHDMKLIDGNPAIPLMLPVLNCLGETLVHPDAARARDIVLPRSEEYFKEASYGEFTPRFDIYKLDSSTGVYNWDLFPSTPVDCSTAIDDDGATITNKFKIFTRCDVKSGTNQLECDSARNGRHPFLDQYIKKVFENELKNKSALEEITAIESGKKFYIPAYGIVFGNGSTGVNMYKDIALSLKDSWGITRTYRVIGRVGNTSINKVPGVLVHELIHSRSLKDLYKTSSEHGRTGDFHIMSGNYSEERSSDVALPHKLMMGWINSTNYEEYVNYIELETDTGNPEVYLNGTKLANKCSSDSGSICVDIKSTLNILNHGSDPSMLDDNYRKYFIIKSDYKPFDMPNYNTYSYGTSTESKPETMIMGRILNILKTNGKHVGHRVNYSKRLEDLALLNRYNLNLDDSLFLYTFNRYDRSGLNYTKDESEMRQFIDIIEQDNIDTKADGLYVSSKKYYENHAEVYPTELELKNYLTSDTIPKGFYPYIWNEDGDEMVIDDGLSGTYLDKMKKMDIKDNNNWPGMDRWIGILYRFNTNDRFDSHDLNRFETSESYSLPKNRVVLTGKDENKYHVTILNLKKNVTSGKVDYSFRLVLTRKDKLDTYKESSPLYLYDDDNDNFCDEIDNSANGCFPDLDTMGSGCYHDFGSAVVNSTVFNVNGEPFSGYNLSEYGKTILCRTNYRNGMHSPDNCPGLTNQDQQDSDSDGVGDLCDSCPNYPNGNNLDVDISKDYDSDGIPDACDLDWLTPIITSAVIL